MLQKLKDSNIMDNEIKELMIPADKVAHVQLGNPLEHALLVLIKSGYSAIPVLDSSYKLHGQISKALILDSIIGLERFELERLNEQRVENVMEEKIPWINKNSTFSRALAMSINHPFICILDDDRSFIGILTRRSILALINRYLQK
ncbi:MAG: CBS domain-containing protein [Bacillaceae bacterium]|uniref:CBS domain-containing protein n=1 Tax=Alkalihalobacterium chitinilyticum TaxID=2980103 RepID=A0ABT5VDA0_9BACI|nr:cyclic-di-AMP-binding protein CbpB [Alkalihalobacterium chitinilyticum]MDE5412184.1 CBS domain-containing protein [Alkalihalobacterium chitinilyticum]MEB1806481.1 CBS domain-containing protein [Bacillaceae bacterium]